jgi:hypothetical protein
MNFSGGSLMQSRRDFLKTLLTFSAIPLVLSMSKNLFAEEKKKRRGEDAGGGFGDAVPGKGSAGSLGYQVDKNKVPKASQIAKGTPPVPFEKQFCHNCILYKDGICQAMTDNNKKVKPNGWCNSWTLNPAVKS